MVGWQPGRCYDAGMADIVVSPEFAAYMRRAVSDEETPPFPMAGYRAHVAAWLAWCFAHDVDPEHATTPDVARYQRELLRQGAARGAVAFRTAGVRWFYQSMIAAGLRRDNPAAAMGFFHGY